MATSQAMAVYVSIFTRKVNATLSGMAYIFWAPHIGDRGIIQTTKIIL